MVYRAIVSRHHSCHRKLIGRGTCQNTRQPHRSVRRPRPQFGHATAAVQSLPHRWNASPAPAAHARRRVWHASGASFCRRGASLQRLTVPRFTPSIGADALLGAATPWATSSQESVIPTATQALCLNLSARSLAEGPRTGRVTPLVAEVWGAKPGEGRRRDVAHRPSAPIAVISLTRTGTGPI